MATKKQISSLITYSINNDKEKIFEVAQDIANSQKDQKMIDRINSMVLVSKWNIKSQSVDVTLEPEKNYKDYLYEAQYSNYKIDDIILPKPTKDKINNWVKELKNLDFLSSYNLPLQTRALFFGDTGLGKTMTAYVVANQLWKPLLILNLSSIISSKLWETSKNLNFVFQVAQEKEAIIFLDEIDFIWNKRDSSQDHWEIRRALLALIQILDLIPQDIIVIAATNMIESLDAAVIRRFWLRIEFKLPDVKLILDFLKKLQLWYNFSILESSKQDLAEYLLWKNYHDIKNIILNAFKNKLLHFKSKRKNIIELSLQDVKKFQYLDF
jgi:AAA+ superfamily predicted ATPase